MNRRLVTLTGNGFKLTVTTDAATDTGSVRSNLHHPANEPDAEHWNAAVDMLEAVVLAHALAGIEVAAPAYVEGLNTAIEAASNHL